MGANAKKPLKILPSLLLNCHIFGRNGRKKTMGVDVCKRFCYDFSDCERQVKVPVVENIKQACRYQEDTMG